MKSILLVCGAGASSTFLAHSMRRESKSRNLDVSIVATSQDDVADRLAEADVLLVGPHLQNAFDDLSENATALGVPSALLPPDVFAAGGQAAALDLAITLLLTSTTPSPHAPSPHKDLS